MPRFLIEIPHGDDEVECRMAVQAFLITGSHFVANAEWGCSDGEHKGWLLLDADSREAARSVVPPSLRPQAKIVQLEKFTMQQVDQVLSHHHS